MGLRKRSAALGAVASAAAAALAIAGCSSGSSSSTPAATGGTASSTAGGTSSAPSTLTVWRMGGSVPSQVTWMNGVEAQFHQQFPQYAKTQVKVDWIPWSNRTTDWNSALSSGKNIDRKSVV